MKQRKRVDRFARLLSLIYDKPYNKVESLYFKCDCDVRTTKQLINTI